MKTSITVIVSLGVVLAAAMVGLGNGRTDDAIGVAVSPQQLILSQEQGGKVTVHTGIPLALVDPASVTLEGVCALVVRADSLGRMVADFDEVAIEALVEAPQAVLTLRGVTKGGDAFSGQDLVKVKL